MFTKKNSKKPAAYEKVAPNIMKIVFQPAGGADTLNSYAEQLRSLGQVFEKFTLTSFEVMLEAGAYTVIGKTPTQALDTIALIQRLQAGARGDENLQQPVLNGEPMTLGYSARDVENLSVMGKAKRAAADKVPDGHGMSQMLRSVGGWLDRNAGAVLISIRVANDWVAVRYRRADGTVEEENRHFDYFYDYWVKMYMRRKGRSQPARAKEPTLFVRWDDADKVFRLSNSPA